MKLAVSNNLLLLLFFLIDNTVAVVTNYVTNTITTCSAMIGQLSDTIIVASSERVAVVLRSLNGPSRSESWKVLKTVMSH